MSLHAKQEAFCQAYMLSGNGADAYRAAYDVPEDTSPEAVWQQASRLLVNHKIVARLETLRKVAQQEAAWSGADRFHALKGIFDAVAASDPFVAICAIAEANKMQGSYPSTHLHLAGPSGDDPI